MNWNMSSAYKNTLEQLVNVINHPNEEAKSVNSFCEFIKYLKSKHYRSEDIIIKENYSFIANLIYKFFPVNTSTIIIPSSLRIRLKANIDSDSDLHNQVAFCSIDLIIKIQNIEIFQTLNLFVIALILFQNKEYEECLELLNGRSLFSLIFENSLNCDILLQGANDRFPLLKDFLRMKCLNLYLFSNEKLQRVQHINSYIFKLYRACCSEDKRNTLITNLLINFITRQFISKRAYQQAFTFIQKTIFDENVSVMSNMRHHYYMSKILLIRSDYIQAYEYAVKVLRNVVYYNFIQDGSFNSFCVEVLKLYIIASVLIADDKKCKEMEMLIYTMRFRSSWKSCAELKRYSMLKFIVENGKLHLFNLFVHSMLAYDDLYLTFLRLRSQTLIQCLRSLNRRYQNQSMSIAVIAKEELYDEYSVEDLIFILMKNIKENHLQAKLNFETATIQFISQG